MCPLRPSILFVGVSGRWFEIVTSFVTEELHLFRDILSGSIEPDAFDFPISGRVLDPICEGSKKSGEALPRREEETPYIPREVIDDCQGVLRMRWCRIDRAGMFRTKRGGRPGSVGVNVDQVEGILASLCGGAPVRCSCHFAH